MRVELIKPISYCEGVNNAINIALKVRKDNPSKNIFIYGQLVHNKYVEQFLNKNNIVTLERNIDEILKLSKNDSIVILSAHGHSKALENILMENNISFVDATCEKVAHTHHLILEHSKNSQVIYIGIAGHPETEGIIHESSNIVLYDANNGIDYTKITDTKPFVINQTTLNNISLRNIHKDIHKHFPKAIFSDEICPTTRLRQEHISQLNDDIDLVVIVGDYNSSNTQRLYEIAKLSNPNKEVILINSVNDFDNIDLKNKKNAAVASGASTPMDVINSVIKYLEKIN